MKLFIPVVLFSLLVAAQQPDADTHRGWMNDAADLQEDLREAFQLKDSSKAVDVSEKIEALMAQTESYWAAKKANDVVKLAQDARALAKQMGAAAGAGKLDDAQKAFGDLNATCNTCHDLHPEKR